MSDIMRYLGDSEPSRREQKELARLVNHSYQSAKVQAAQVEIDAQLTAYIMRGEVETLSELMKLAGDNEHLQQLAARRWTQFVGRNDERLSGKKRLF